jgi:hypothetical protein
MTPARYGAALAVLCVTAGASGALAAPKAACLQVTDVAGDGTSGGAVPHRDALDILSADVATGKRNLVAVLRLASVAADPTLTTGVSYRFAWRAGGVDQAMTLTQFSDGNRVSDFDPNTAFGANNDNRTPQLVVDQATNTITWSVTRKANPVLAKKGTKFSALSAAADPSFNIGAPGFTATMSFVPGDTASSGKTYTDLAPSCVKGV